MNRIHTSIRIRPITDCDLSEKIDYNILDNSLNISQKKIKFNSEIIYKKNKYNFDEIYDDYNTNDDIFNITATNMLNKFLDNNDVVFYVFGQTGSGKTHTIFGDKNTQGIFPLVCNYLLDSNYEFEINAVEIYNNKCYDLLSNKQVFEREDGNNTIHIQGVISYKISNKYVLNNLINKIIKKRRVGVSGRNNQSSRSHMIIKIIIGNNYFKIVDLAGSEKAKYSIYINKSIFRENSEINKSLFVLKECIRSIRKGKTYVPYRGSKLTKVLKDSFSKNTYTYVIGTIIPENKCISDTLNTLFYISELKFIKNSNKKKNIQTPKRCSPQTDYIVNNINDLNLLTKKRKEILNEINNNKLTPKYKRYLLYLIDEELYILNRLKHKLLE